MRRILCLTALSLLPFQLHAATPQADICKDAPSPPEPWTSWMQSGSDIAGGDTQSAPRLILGKPVVATLRPAVQVQYAVKPERQRPKSFGGLFTLSVKTAARVGFGLSGRARVYVAQDNLPFPPVGYGHGPECSGIESIVWFDLPPGIHLIQIADSPARQLRLMAADAVANQPLPRLPEPDH